MDEATGAAMMLVELMHAGALLLALVLLPGLLICLSLRGTPREWLGLLICSIGVSLAYLIPLGIGLLGLSLFNLQALAIGCTPVLALALWRRAELRAAVRALRIEPGNASAVAVVLGGLGVMLLATPHWSFLINVAWDAGSYETYANHFWRTGSLQLDISDLLARDLPIEWGLSSHTWIAEHDQDAQLSPDYLLGFPVYLGLVKLLLGRPDAAWVAMALISLVSAGLLTLIAVRLSGRWWLGALIVLSIISMPLFYYYAKLAMSEQLGLLGLLLATFVMLESEPDGSRDEDVWGPSLLIFCGLLVTFLTKLDAFPFALFFAATMAIAVTEQSTRASRFARAGVAAAIAFAAAAVVHVFTADADYLSKFSIFAPQTAWPIPLLLIYAALILGIAFATRYWSQHAPAALARPAVARSLSLTATAVASALWVLFMLWSWMLRPVEWSGDPLEDHDLANLVRLSAVTSPVLLSFTLMAFPVVLAKAAPALRSLLLAFGLFLCYLLWNSHHSPYELIWMRRYLMPLIPIMAMVAPAAAGMLVSRRVLAAPALAAALAALIGVQLVLLEPLLNHELHTRTADQILALNDRIPSQALLIINTPPESRVRPESGDWMLRGAGNTLRSLRDGPTLLNVPIASLDKAIEAFSEVEPVFVLATRLPPPGMLETLALEPQDSMRLSTQYSSWLVRIREDPVKTKTISVYVMKRRETDQATE
jgi:hypothetical protein